MPSRGPSSNRPSLILASSSPQRKRLLAGAGYQFRIVEPSPQAECGICSRESPGEMVARLARQKGADVVERLRATEAAAEQPGNPAGEVVLACDTVAECLGRILGKPTDREHAREMLKFLSGRDHRVYSGLCLWPLANRDCQVRVARTTLRMDTLSDDQIEEYLAGDEWQGKAGAFGYQDRTGWLHIVEGSESNVIGLPLELLAEMLS